MRESMTEISELIAELQDTLDKEVRLRQNILDALPCVALLLRHNTHEIVAANKAAVARGAVVGGSCYHSQGRHKLPCPWCRAPAPGQDGRANHRQFWDMEIYWDCYWIPVADDLSLHYAFDITEQEKNKTALQKANDDLRRRVGQRSAELQQAHRRLLHNEKFAAVGRVSAAIAQEFNDPLQAITNVLGGIYRRGSLDPEDMPLVDLAYREVTKLNNLVGELREFYQPVHGKTDLFDVRLELEEIIGTNRPRLAGKGITLTTQFAEEMPLLQVVAAQIREVFQTLLDNAVEACGRDDTIHISTFVDQESVVLRIIDSGRGIDQSVHAQLFEPFNSSKPKKSAKGLRLAKAQAMITMHGGTIESEDLSGNVFGNGSGNGSAFKVVLPRHCRGSKDGGDNSDHVGKKGGTF
jgi:signal transduction histidine kinase